MRLIICDSPTAAKTISSAVEGANLPKRYTVVCCPTHAFALMEPEEIDPEWKSWNPDLLPIDPYISYKILPKKRKQVESIITLMNSPAVEAVINACSPSPEGEFLFDCLYKGGRCQKETFRLWLEWMESDYIIAKLNAHETLFWPGHLVLTAYNRNRADWMVRYNFTRLFSKLQHRACPVNFDLTPLAAELVRREQEIKQFVPKQKWQVKVEVQGISFVHRCSSQKEMQRVAELCKGQSAVVSLFKERTRHEEPLELYNLTDLMIEMEQEWQIPPITTVTTLRDLYERGMISYPFTEYRCVRPPDLDPFAYSLYNIARQFSFFDGSEKWHYTLWPIQGRIQGLRHNAPRPTPTGLRQFSQLTMLERTLIETLSFRLAEATQKNCCWIDREAELIIAGFPFRGTWSSISEIGWRKVAEMRNRYYGKPHDPLQMDTTLTMDTGASFPVDQVVCEKLSTCPPTPYTDAELLRLMEEQEIGSIEARPYILQRLRKINDPASYVAGLPDTVTSLDATAQVRQRIAEIQRGEPEGQAAYDELTAYVTDVIETERQKLRSPQAHNRKVTTCPMCGKAILHHIDPSKDQDLFHCSNRNCPMVLFNPLAGRTVSDSEVEELMRFGRTEVLNGFVGKSGTTFPGCLVLRKNNAGNLTGSVELVMLNDATICRCPVCGDFIIPFYFGEDEKNAQSGWRCRNRNCRLLRFDRVFHGRRFYTEEVVELFTKGKTPILHGFKNDVTGYVRLKHTSKGYTGTFELIETESEG